MGPVARPDLATRYSLVLTCAKNTLFCNSQHRGLPGLRKRRAGIPRSSCIPRRRERAASPTVTGSRSRRPRAASGPVARFNAGLDPRVVVGQHGWWQALQVGAPGYDPFRPAGANYNLLIARRARPGQRHGVAALLSLRDPPPSRGRHRCEPPVRMSPRTRAAGCPLRSRWDGGGAGRNAYVRRLVFGALAPPRSAYLSPRGRSIGSGS